MTNDIVTIQKDDIEAIGKAILLAKDLTESQEMAAGFEAWKRLRLAALRARVRRIKESPAGTQVVAFAIVALQEEPTLPQPNELREAPFSPSPEG